MSAVHLRRLPLLLLFAAALGACGEGTGPNFRPFDPDRAEADVAAAMSAFESPLLQAYNAAVGRMPVFAPPANALPAGNPLVAAAITVPPQLLGATFVIDPTTLQYQASDRTGAPANGVRYIVYALDGSTIDPTQEVGRIDVIDLMPAGADEHTIRVQFVRGTVTPLDFTFALSGPDPARVGTISGFVSDGTTRIDFVTILTVIPGHQFNTVNAEFQYTIPARSFGMVGTVIGFGGGAEGQVDVLFNTNRTRVQFVTDGLNAPLGTVSVNLRPFATVAGDAFAGVGGRQLTQAEHDGLVALSGLRRAGFYWPLHLSGIMGAPFSF